MNKILNIEERAYLKYLLMREATVNVGTAPNPEQAKQDSELAQALLNKMKIR